MILRRWIISIVLIVAVLLVSAKTVQWLYETKPTAERSRLKVLPPLVKTEVLSFTDVQERFEGYGNARADVDVRLAAEVGGVITHVGVDVRNGAAIRQGTLLIQIDDREHLQWLAKLASLIDDVDAQIDALQVEEDNARKMLAIAEQEVSVNRDELSRLSKLFESAQASQREVDLAHVTYQRSRRESQAYQNELSLIAPRRKRLEATRGAHQADAQAARLIIEKCQIVAPIDGRIDTLSVKAGDRVLPGHELMRVMSTRMIEVPIELPASVMPFASVGQPCRLTLESLTDVIWQGRISRLAPSADPQTRTFSAYVVVDNEQQSTPLVPGYYVNATVDGPLWSGVLTVPRGAIVNDTVFIVNDDSAHLRPIQTERIVGDRAIITGQIAEGDRVILTNLDTLEEGASVRIQVTEEASRPTQPD